MKITDIIVSRRQLALTRPYTIAYKTVSSVDMCWVEVHTDQGIIGKGSANPSKQVVGESMDDTMEALSGELLDRLKGHDIRTCPAICESLHTWLPAQPGAKAALDIALHDAWGQVLGLPLVSIWGQQHAALPTSITIGIKDVAETLEEADEYIGRGFKILKVKLGQSLQEDLERLAKLRETFGESIGIRVDANQGYTPEQVSVFFKETEEWAIELVEQPIPADEVAEMRKFPRETRNLIAADESLVTADDAWQLAQMPKACGIFNIKLMKCGGIHQARRIAEVARLSDTELMWGCNDESVVSIAAALHTALSYSHTRYLDLDGSLDLASDLAKGGFVLKDGMMSLAGRPGLGVY
ncbi:dipeptide epimerase [Pontibacter sp. G13]|uniref:mandelate racemase/muconate lactonizing enzyme family protein n=1 Tax=Pontibacter sp. G13 TaxID=3074898 RepID=UPI00288945B6|nr:dipeptide epimerase [Pontibacter sp. G13]WNJ16135.1 dipeptide epimerase [Pontibacter sp. G13]